MRAQRVVWPPKVEDRWLSQQNRSTLSPPPPATPPPPPLPVRKGSLAAHISHRNEHQTTRRSPWTSAATAHRDAQSQLAPPHTTMSAYSARHSSCCAARRTRAHSLARVSHPRTRTPPPPAPHALRCPPSRRARCALCSTLQRLVERQPPHACARHLVQLGPQGRLPRRPPACLRPRRRRRRARLRNYKVDEFKDMLGRSYGRLSDRAKEAYSGISELGADALENARDSWEALSERLDAIELPDTPGFLRNLFSGFSGSQSSQDASGASKWSAGGGSGGPDPNGTSAMAGAAAVVASSLFGDDEPSTDGTADAASKTSTEELMLLTRKLIEVRNILKDIDHESDQLTLPSIVVIGSQSSGKSSVLEAIVGHEFLPKGNNMVTRRPIELTLIHTPAQPGRATKDTLVEYAEFPASASAASPTFRTSKRRSTTSTWPCPRPNRQHGPARRAARKIQTLCQKYIQEPNIILAVCAADVDLANSPALRASRQVDPLGLRTIGVVTKMDLVPPEVGAAILSNNKYPLSLGYVGVVCKNSLGMFQSAQGHDRAGQGRMASMVTKQESDYFNANREHFKAPARGRNAGVEPMTGTDTLRRRLMTVLEESMGSSLHGIANAVQVELEEASYQFKGAVQRPHHHGRVVRRRDHGCAQAALQRVCGALWQARGACAAQARARRKGHGHPRADVLERCTHAGAGAAGGCTQAGAGPAGQVLAVQAGCVVVGADQGGDREDVDAARGGCDSHADRASGTERAVQPPSGGGRAHRGV
ncbi:hypothetical protein L1887_57484 [Cichorium endivia]|nr:hypothetical protein L1887_57484 [Cichorium endivia]